MKLKIFVFIFFFTVSITSIIDGRRISSSRSRTSSSSSWRSSSRPPSSSRVPSSRTSSSSHTQSTHTTFGNGRVSTSGSTNSLNRPTSSTNGRINTGTGGLSNPSNSHISPSNNHASGSVTSNTHQQNKDVSSTFLQAEGGGARRPGIGNRQEHTQFTTDKKQQSSPHAPSAPPEQISKSNSASMQNHGSPFGQSVGEHQRYPIPSNPPIGFNINHNQRYGSPPNQNPPQNNVNTHSNTLNSHNPPIGFNPNILPYNSSVPLNTYKPSAPYPTHPFPPTSFPSSDSVPHLTYPHISHPIASAPQSLPPFGHSANYPQSGHTPVIPFTNPYSTQSAGSPHISGPVIYPQQGHVLAQPVAQPYIPGQTVIMVPGQQDRGLGQMVKEALVFSTVNAGVNRIFNSYPSHHHYISDSKPSTDVTSSTTHITYNNQYFNTYPGTNVTMDGSNTPQGIPSNQVNMPTGVYKPTSTGTSGIPTSSNVQNINVPNQSNGVAGTTLPTSNTLRNDATLNVSNTTSANGVERTSMNTPSNGNTMLYKISDEELWKITEKLYMINEFDVSKYVTLNLQNQSTSVNITDEAKDPLFYVQPEVYEIPTIRAIRALYDNYMQDSRIKEIISLEKRKEQNLFLDVCLSTNVVSSAMEWLAKEGFIDPDDFERKETLRQIWFLQFDGSTSGFERIFTSEVYGDKDVLGVQDWIYFNYQESLNRINYMGYVDKLNFGDKTSLVKLNFQMNGIIRPNATIFVGTTPELEMSLYTICFYARPNNLCPVSLAGTKFTIYTHSFRYFGKDLIDFAIPIF